MLKGVPSNFQTTHNMQFLFRGTNDTEFYDIIDYSENIAFGDAFVLHTVVIMSNLV